MVSEIIINKFNFLNKIYQSFLSDNNVSKILEEYDDRNSSKIGDKPSEERERVATALDTLGKSHDKPTYQESWSLRVEDSFSSDFGKSR